MKDGLLKELLEAPEANSRFVYLLQGVCTSVSVLLLSIVFAMTHDRAGCGMLMTAVGGGHFAASIGRFFTKVGDNVQPDDNQSQPKQ